MRDRFTKLVLDHPRAVILAAVLLVWGQTLRFDFVWDDYFFIQENLAIRTLTSIPDMFTSLEAQAAFADGFRVYRPLRTAHYALLYFLGGGQNRPMLFHLANVCWHGAAACLVFAVALRLLRRRTAADTSGHESTAVALAAGLAFAVHPVLSETVSWAKGLDDIMAAVFTLLATRLLLDWDGRWGKTYCAMVAAYVAAMYSKESAVPWAAFAFLIFWRFHKRSLGYSVVLSLPLVAFSVLSLWHRHAVIGRTSQIAPISGTYGQTLIDMFVTVGPYLRLALGIPPFSIDYSYMTGGHALTSPAVVVGVGLVIIVAGLTVSACISPHDELAGLGGAWFLLFMLPVSNLVPMMQYMAERFLYLPLVGCILAAAGWAAGMPRRRLAAGVAAVTIMLWAGAAWARSSIWKDEVTLFGRSYEQGPRSARLERNAISALLKQPHMEDVFTLVPYPDRLPLLELAPPARRAGADWPRVVETGRQLTSTFPESPFANEAAGLIFSLGGEPREGALVLERAAAGDPENARIWGNLGGAYLASGQFDRAIPALERSRQLAPNSVVVLQALGAAYRRQGDFVHAAPVYETLMKLEPANPDNARWLEESRAKIARP
jgi:protein O-mannosyl-transferase